MFFAISKLIWALLQPSNLLLLVLGAAALALALGRRWLGARLLAIGLGALLVASVLPLGQWLLVPLENRFPSVNELPAEVDGIVVLGGSADLPVTAARGQVALLQSAERFTTAIELARRRPAARVIFTGYSGQLLGSRLAEADVMRAFWRQQGLDPARLALEDRARNTYQNALLAKRLVAPRPGATWLLVTSAFHMPRAVGVFRAAGWPVTAYPVDYRTTGQMQIWVPFDVARRLAELDLAARAWTGLLVYWLTGRSEALFPAP